MRVKIKGSIFEVLNIGLVYSDLEFFFQLLEAQIEKRLKMEKILKCKILEMQICYLEIKKMKKQ